jgi:dephospho-CoA kinase
MLIVGLTGSIGMGKSTAAARLREHGLAVFDADAEVHRLYAGPLAADIEAAFPGSTSKGTVDRGKLAAQLIANPEKFRQLEAIVHPKVRDAERWFLNAENRRGAAIAVLEIPLLFEAGAEKQVDVVIVVTAPREVQRQRVLERPGMTENKFELVVARQLSEPEKWTRADFVVDTSGTIEKCHSQIDAIIPKLATRASEAFDRYWRD